MKARAKNFDGISDVLSFLDRNKLCNSDVQITSRKGIIEYVFTVFYWSKEILD